MCVHVRACGVTTVLLERSGSCKIEKKSLAFTNDRPFCLNLLSPCTLGKY